MTRIDHRVIELVGSHIGERGIPLEIEEARLLLKRRVGPTDVQAMRIIMGIIKILRDHDPDPIRIDLDRCRGFDHFSDGLHRDPQARPARHRPAMQAEIEIFLHGGRIKHRQATSLEDVIRLMRQGRTFCAVIVARQGQHTAVARCPRRIRMLEHIAGAIDARTLAVPHRKDALHPRFVREVELLRAPDRGRRQVFIEPRLKHNLMLLQMRARLPERLIKPAQGRSAIARDKPGGVESGKPIALALQHRQANQRLRARHESTAAFESVFVVERDLAQRALQIGLNSGIEWRIHFEAPCENRITSIRQLDATTLMPPP